MIAENTHDQELRALRAAIRQQARDRRVEAAETLGHEAARLIIDRVVENIPLPPRKIISGYWPTGSELDDRLLLIQLHGIGRSCCLPVVIQHDAPLIFREWGPRVRLEPDNRGMMTPPASEAETEPDILFVPLLAFDRNGNRLGSGAGYYDRTLDLLRQRRKIVSIGLAYSIQEFAEIPVFDHDQPLDWIVTEREVIRVTPGFEWNLHAYSLSR